jgi:hypothetical protein
MDERRTLRGLAHAELRAVLKSHAVPALLVAMTTGMLALVIVFVPRQLVLPVVSLAAFTAAALAALRARTCGAKREGENVTAWDIAGGLVLIGCAAGILSKPENVVHLMAHIFQ